MTSDDTRRLCFHIDVPELIDQLGSAALVFRIHQIKPGQREPLGQEDVEVLIPYPVLQSMYEMLPTVLAHLKERGAEELYKPPAERN